MAATSNFTSFGAHTDLDGHACEIIRGAEIGSPERNSLARIARHSHAYEIAISDNGIGRIQLHPAGAGQIDVAPGVGGTAAVVFTITVAQVKVAGYKPRCQTQRTQGLDHQERQVAAAAATEL